MRRVVLIALLFFFFSSWATINQVRVINHTNEILDLLIGGYLPAKKIPPQASLVLQYPFITKFSNNTEEKTGLLVVTAGGKWVTTEKGNMYLDNPKLVQCMDYDDEQNRHLSGNRFWVIQRLDVDRDCFYDKLKGKK